MDDENKKNDISWHSLSVEDVIVKLNSSSIYGLELNEVKSRLANYGTNTLPDPKKRSIFSILSNQFLSPLIHVLFFAALVAFFIGEKKDAVVILVIIFLNAIIGTIQEGRAERSIEGLRKLSKLMARVYRNSKQIEVEASEVVPGDILILNAGDAIAADARLIKLSTLLITEAPLTGESVPVTKSVKTLPISTMLSERTNMVYAGTYVAEGRATAIVVSSGLNNEIGKIAQLASEIVTPKTRLQIRIQNFGRQLIIAAILVFILVVSIGVYQGISFSEILMIAIGQLVSLVPEGLPVAITIALAVGVQRISKKRTIIRQMSAIETLGTVTVICSDKTGTLTRNEMSVTEIYLPAKNRIISVAGVGYNPQGSFVENGKQFPPTTDKTLSKLFEACALCNDAQLVAPNNINSNWSILGDPTEGALLTLVAKADIDLDSLKKKFPRVTELPFNTEKKYMVTEHSDGQENVIFIKGAPEVILNYCESIYDDGNIINIDKKMLEDIKNASKKMASSALRLLAFGYSQEVILEKELDFNSLKNNLIFIGLIGELDPPRPEVANSVLQCQTAGIKPVMITGDHKITGIAIAKKLGFYHDNDLAIDGTELERLTERELLEKIDHFSVFARVLPAQKLRIIEALQKKGQVVAMTGDGVNDVPALLKADIGVVMGITGTEVAKESAKIVITDDNFATIVNAISQGRLVYQNIKKLILYLFVTSIDEVLLLLLALIFGYPPPLVAVQILWINLVTEGALSVNLIMEPPEGNEMHRPPTPITEPLLDRDLLSRIPLMVIASVISTFGWFIYRTSQGTPIILVRTETFTLLAICQWFNVLNCRSSLHSVFKWNLLKNLWLMAGLIIAIILHYFVIYWKPLNVFFHTVPIEPGIFLKIGIVASFVLWIEEIRKIRARKLKKNHKLSTNCIQEA
jgi:magnesium-transporting ATPase (P-type)